MEAPVAAALGKVQAINLFDPYWNDVEYDVWYHMLNCGVRLPASTGSDWFVSSANRVYAHGSPQFSYDEWLEAVRAGRTFITNGPALFLSAAGEQPGSVLQARPGESVPVHVSWNSHYTVDRVEVVMNGTVVAATEPSADPRSGKFEAQVPVSCDGWVAARIASSHRDSFNQPVWAHTSPVYITGSGVAGDARRASAQFFVDRIDESIEWVRKKGKFYTDAQRDEVLDLHRAGQDVYRKLLS
jgi:hypothetical protein